jgi:hypothetical protein
MKCFHHLDTRRGAAQRAFPTNTRWARVADLNRQRFQNSLHRARGLLKAGRLQRAIRYFQRPSQAILAVLLGCLVLLLNAMAASPALHVLLHHDADSAEHHCAVTMLAQGQVDSPVAAVMVVVPVASSDFSPLTLVSVFAARVESPPSSRGPPVSLLLS